MDSCMSKGSTGCNGQVVAILHFYSAHAWWLIFILSTALYSRVRCTPSVSKRALWHNPSVRNLVTRAVLLGIRTERSDMNISKFWSVNLKSVQGGYIWQPNFPDCNTFDCYVWDTVYDKTKKISLSHLLQILGYVCTSGFIVKNYKFWHVADEREG